MGSAVLLRSKATSRQRKSSSPIRSASSTSTSPKCRPPRESSTSSWRSTELRSSPSSNLPKKPIVLPHRPSWSPWSKPFPTKSIRCSPIMASSSGCHRDTQWAERAIYDAHVRSALPRARYRTPIHQDQSSLDQWPGRTNEPHDQGRNRQTLSLRRSRPVAPPSRRLRRRLQFRTPSEDPQRPHAIRVRLKMLDFRARPIHTQPTPSNSGTEHLTFPCCTAGMRKPPSPTPPKRKPDLAEDDAVASRAVVPRKRDPRQPGIFDAPLPPFIRPQLAKLVIEAPEGERWAHELKFDGYRMHARIDRGKVQLITARSALDWTSKYPGLAEWLKALDR